MPITNGTIEYSRRLKTGDYEHKDGKASISFTVPEGEDPEKLASYARQIAHAQTTSMLVGEVTSARAEPEKPTRAKREPKDIVIGETHPVTDPMIGSSASVAPTPTASPPVPVEGSSNVAPPAAGLDSMTGSILIPRSPAAGVSPDPMAMGGGPTSASVAGGPVTDASPPAPIGVSDADLTSHITAKLTGLKALIGDVAVQKIAGLVWEYVPQPGRSTQMTQEQRVNFLARLKDLA